MSQRGEKSAKIRRILVSPAFHCLVEPSIKGSGGGMNLAGWSVKTLWLSGDSDFAGRWVLGKNDRTLMKYVQFTVIHFK